VTSVRTELSSNATTAATVRPVQTNDAGMTYIPWVCGVIALVIALLTLFGFVLRVKLRMRRNQIGVSVELRRMRSIDRPAIADIVCDAGEDELYRSSEV
jgi:hypothetical protein